MRTITIPDEIYDSITELATGRGQTVEQLLADLIAQEQWEEHATQAYDAYHARGGPGQSPPREALTEEEFFHSLQTAAENAESDADV